MVILDTSALIEILAGTERGLKLKEILGKGKLATTPITVNEALVSIRPKDGKIFRDFLETLEIIPFDKGSAFKSVEIEDALMKKGDVIGKLDIFIAAICIQKNIPLATFDSDFKRVDGLTLISA